MRRKKTILLLWRILKNLSYILLFLLLLLIAAFYLQPIKKGKGLDTVTKYELVNSWLHLPKDIKLGNPAGIGIDTSGNLIIFHRAGREWPLLGSMPGKPIADKTILIIDKDSGRIMESWGANLFIMPHGLKVDKDNNIWLTDVGLNQVFKFSHDGKLLLKFGEARIAGNDSLHFDQPTDIAIADDGSFYISDGYGNSRIIKFSADGKYLFEWGSKGKRESEFSIPHGIALDRLGNVYVADRENNRIQVFDRQGKFIKQYSDDSFGAICSVAFNKERSKLFATDDFSFLKLRHRGSDVFVFDSSGKVQTRFGRSGSYEGHVSWYHALAVDKDENIYVGDILNNTVQKFKKSHY